jgi:hypothetical protein
MLIRGQFKVFLGDDNVLIILDLMGKKAVYGRRNLGIYVKLICLYLFTLMKNNDIFFVLPFAFFKTLLSCVC